MVTGTVDPLLAPATGDVEGDDGAAVAGVLADLARRLLAVDPHGLGGALVCAAGSIEAERWTAAYRALAASDVPWRRLPVSITDDRLVGGLDVAETLARGTRVLARGLLAEADGGTLLLARAADAPARLVSVLAAALDTAEVTVERDGLSARAAARVSVVAIAQGEDERGELPAPLAERLALHILLPTGYAADAALGWPTDDPEADRELVAAARAALPQVALPRAAVAALCEAAEALGVASPRATVLAARCARASAALEGRSAPGADDLARAVRLVLAPRATRMPVSEEPPEAPEPPPPSSPEAQQPPDAAETPPPPPPSEDATADAPEDRALDPEALGELLLAAAQATLPRGLLSAQGRTAGRTAPPRDASGRKGEERRDDARGRRVGTRQGRPRGGARLDVLESLRAAAPWQRLRAAARLPGTPSGPARRRQRGAGEREPLEIRPEDLRVQRRRRRTGTTTIFVVDASGSAALGRLAEAKGAVELLLAESYVRRDRVGLIAFRGVASELLLPPTRALTRARRAIGALPGGGGTPLAAALVQAAASVDGVLREGARAAVVVLTDGRANIALDGTPGRPRALEDARAAARALRARPALVVVVDTSPRGDANARALAEACGARYVALPVVTARALHAKVREAIGDATPAVHPA